MRLIDADALLSGYDVRKVVEYDESGCGLDYKAVPVGAIETAPTVDAVEVVRCKDCKFGLPTYLNPEAFKRCALFCKTVNADFFCAGGERKMDAEVHDDA